MKTRFIHDKFILDVSHISISWVEENSWFRDEFFLTSSFPFEISFDENEYFERIQHLNITKLETHYKGLLEINGRIEEAILEIEEASDLLRLTIRYGVEALPNWNKKLSDLELDVVLPEGGSMSLHAASIINQTYPTVNYNFPAIHTDFYENETGFELFQKVINKRKPNGDFVQNAVDPGASVQLQNRNIVYPFPYHLYVLEKAIEDAGYTLHGDVLSDPDLIDAIIVPPKKIINFEGLPSPVEWIVSRYEIVQSNPVQIWHSTQEFNVRGDIKFWGTINDEVLTLRLYLNGNLIYSYNQGNSREFFLYLSTNSEENEFTCDISSIGINVSDAAWFSITTIRLIDENGDEVPMIANFSNVQLADMLPDMTVGDFIKFHKRLKNYDFDLRNNKEIWMNLIQNEIENAEVIDLSDHDVKRPTRRFEQYKSYLLQYEGDYDDQYNFDKIYADKNGYKINDFTKAENTTEININGIPLPIEKRKFAGDDFEIETAIQLTDDASKLQLVKYNGLYQSQNWAQTMTGLSPINLFLNHHNQWLNYLINAVIFVWTIKDDSILLSKLKKKSKIYSHNNFMFVYSLNRTKNKNIEEIEIEACSSQV